MPTKTSGWTIEVEGSSRILARLKALGETDAPYLRGALTSSGNKLEDAARGHAVGSMGSRFSMKVGPVAGTLRSLVTVKHSGARPMEFGRVWGVNRITKAKYRLRVGQKAKPMFGIKHGDAAIGQVRDDIQRELSEAIEKEWERLT